VEIGGTIARLRESVVWDNFGLIGTRATAMGLGPNECKGRTVMGYVSPPVLYIRVCIRPLQIFISLVRQEYLYSSFLSILALRHLIRSVVISVHGLSFCCN